MASRVYCRDKRKRNDPVVKLRRDSIHSARFLIVYQNAIIMTHGRDMPSKGGTMPHRFRPADNPLKKLEIMRFKGMPHPDV